MTSTSASPAARRRRRRSYSCSCSAPPWRSWTRPTPAWTWTPCAPSPSGVEEYQKDKQGALLIITHSTKILEALQVDATHVLVDGKLVAAGDGSLVEEINENGFERFLNA